MSDQEIKQYFELATSLSANRPARLGALRQLDVYAEKDNVAAMLGLVVIHGFEQYGFIDLEKSRQLLDKAVQLGSAEAQSMRGNFLLFGLAGFARNEVAGVAELEKSYELGVKRSAFPLALHFFGDAGKLTLWYCRTPDHMKPALREGGPDFLTTACELNGGE